jgi:hypothetical protein
MNIAVTVRISEGNPLVEFDIQVYKIVLIQIMIPIQGMDYFG